MRNKRLFQALRKLHPERREHAAQSMIALDIHSTEDLLRLLRDPETSDSLRIKSLSIVADLRIRDALADALQLFENSGNLRLVHQAGLAIAAIRSKSATRRLILIAVQPANAWRQQEAVYALWFLRDRRARRALRWVVDCPDSSDGTRGLAAEALGMYRDSLPFLLDRTTHPSADIRCGALYGICVITRERAILERCRFLLNDKTRLNSGGQTVAELAKRVLEQSEEELPGQA